ncbi:MAG TPA: efflux transporter periplasmic adaptor subunit [Prolixibacteraceae bacterium]|jgi:membrane fusion protein (multidrug efflux system)|nr:efflux transporter periplasmic adaptor subunit [Prolixibacteraceae bacterium]
MKYNSSIGALIVVSLLISCHSKIKEPAAKERPPVGVDVIVAGAEVVASNLEVNGTVVSNEMVELRPEISGRLTYLNIPDGTKVTKGAILAKVNDADLQAQLEQQKTQLDLALKTEKRLGDLLKVNGVNQADYDVALSQVNSIQATIKVLNAQIDKTVIRAPFSGELGLREVSPGAFVTPQTLIGTLQQTDKVKIDFTVPETFASIIKKGDLVTIQTNGMDDPVEASITAIEPQINSETRNIKVRAFLSSGIIAPGSFVKVVLKQSRQGIMVPTNAIIPDALSSQVVVVHNKKAVFTNVETGLRNTNLVELTKGINPGDSIIVSGMLFVRPNANIQVQKVRTLKDNE